MALLAGTDVGQADQPPKVGAIQLESALEGLGGFLPTTLPRQQTGHGDEDVGRSGRHLMGAVQLLFRTGIHEGGQHLAVTQPQLGPVDARRQQGFQAGHAARMIAGLEDPPGGFFRMLTRAGTLRRSSGASRIAHRQASAQLAQGGNTPRS